MKLAKIGAQGSERLAAIISDSQAVYVDDAVSELSRETLAQGAMKTLSALDLSARPAFSIAGERLGSPVAMPTKIICVGLNYRKHAREAGAQIPTEPVLFMKSPDTLQGPQDDVLIPPGSLATDYEVELAIVIGAAAVYLENEKEAQKVIAGYAVSQDVSERYWQLERGGQWDKGKSFPTFNPFGPYLVTADDFDPGNQRMWCSVNGELRQDSSTADMIFRPAEIVHYVSNVMQLSPGDIINTGTPQGVGLGFKPPRYLAAGDALETGIEGLGVQRAQVRSTT
jgi:2-keto-4-pentenoate hydratase/2-oxohepta-3-ene-1,7-dioic acid hydratase in catechol pathway